MNAVAPVQGQRPDNQEPQGCRFQAKSESEDRRRSMTSQLKDGQAEKVNSFSTFLFQSLQGLGGPSTKRRAICFLQSTSSKANFIQKHPQVHPEGRFTKYLAQATHKINHHSVSILFPESSAINAKKCVLIYFQSRAFKNCTEPHKHFSIAFDSAERQWA